VVSSFDGTLVIAGRWDLFAKCFGLDETNTSSSIVCCEDQSNQSTSLCLRFALPGIVSSKMLLSGAEGIQVIHDVTMTRVRSKGKAKRQANDSGEAAQAKVRQ
jgi:hypothetical protein